MKTLKQHIQESSLSRIYSFYKQHDTATISAFRGRVGCAYEDDRKITRAENKKRSATLWNMLLAQKFGVTPIDGKYVENYGAPNAEERKEDAYFVVNLHDDPDFKKKLMLLAYKFRQDSITFSKKNGDYFLISTNKCKDAYPGKGKIGVEERLGSPMFSKSGEFYSKVNGRPFIFNKLSPNYSNLSESYPTHIRSIINFVLDENANYFSPAYWIDRHGTVIAPQYNHIGAIISAPEHFGETHRTVADTFKKHNEPISPMVDGKAREEIMIRVLQRGFIRIRETRNKWSVEAWKLLPRMHDSLVWWARNIAKNKNHLYDDLFIHEISSDKMNRSTIAKFSGSAVNEALEYRMFINEDELVAINACCT